MADTDTSFPTPPPPRSAQRGACREIEFPPRAAPRGCFSENYKPQKPPRPPGASQWGGGSAVAGSAPAGERGDVIAQRAAAGARRCSLCSGAASRCRCRPRRGGPLLLPPSSTGPGPPCSYTSLRGCPAPGAALHPFLKSVVLRQAPLHPSRGGLSSPEGGSAPIPGGCAARLGGLSTHP